MRKILQTLTDIRTGHTFRGKITDDPQGDIRVVQIKDIMETSARASRRVKRSRKSLPSDVEGFDSREGSRIPGVRKSQFAISTEKLPRIQWEGAGAPPLLAAGDILLPARGEYYDAVIADGAAPSIATSQLFVLRPRTDTVSPEFLHWYLNQTAARNYFRTHSTGTSIPMLSIKTLGALPVPVPPLETQHRIIALQRLWEQEKQLTERLLHNRETMLAGIFQQLLEH